jgi:hypothetical protein
MNLTKDQINLVLYLLHETIRVHENDYFYQELVKKCREIEKKLEESLNV